MPALTVTALELQTTSQPQLEFERPSEGTSVIVRVVSEGPNIAAHYEGDLAITGSVDRFSFSGKPVPEAFTILLLSFCADVDGALKQEETLSVAEQIASLRTRYSCIGRELYLLSSRTVCSDASRGTTVMGFFQNYLFTLLQIARHVLGDGMSAVTRKGEPVVIVIDRYLAGLQRWDGAGIDWGYETAETISRVQRADLSRKGPVRGTHNGQPAQDARLADLVSLLGGNGTSFRKGIPSAIHTPLADAFRGTTQSIALAAAAAAAAWRTGVQAARLECDDEEIAC